MKNAALTPPAPAVVVRRCAGRVVYAPPLPRLTPSHTYTASSVLGAGWRCETEKTNKDRAGGEMLMGMDEIEPEVSC
jgi:hypothetical protein